MKIATEGTRSSFDLEGVTHDIDDTNHRVVVEFPFEQMDSYRSDFGRGWCDEYLGAHRPVMLVHHNPLQLIGRSPAKDYYQNLGNRAQLVGDFSDFDANPLAKEWFAHVRDDEVPGWSFNYRNARGIPHPSGQRAAVRYTKADMPEFGPTPFPAIPGAGAVGLRSEDQLSTPTLTEIMQLGREGHIDSEGVRALIIEHYPDMRERIVIPDGTQTRATVPQEIVDAIGTSGLRAMTITIGDDGSVSTDGGGAQVDDGTVTDDGADDATTLVTAIDATLDHASAAIGDMDVTTLPDNVQQAIALMEAAGVAVDELQNVLGIEDPDDPIENGSRADTEVDTSAWDFDASKYSPEQLKASCLVVDGDTKDKMHLPVRTPDGKLNKNAVHAAAGALAGARGGVKLSDADKKAAADKLVGLYAKIGDKPPASLEKLAGSGSRSEDDQAELAAKALGRIDRHAS